MEYTIKIEGTCDYDVARALAYLSGFREYQAMTRSPAAQRGAGREAIIFHTETVAKDPDLFPATQAPDIIVSRLLEDKYVIELNERVEPSLLRKLEEEIRRVYAERQTMKRSDIEYV